MLFCEIAGVSNLGAVINAGYFLTVLHFSNCQQLGWPEYFYEIYTFFPGGIFGQRNDLYAVFIIAAIGIVQEFRLTDLVLACQYYA